MFTGIKIVAIGLDKHTGRHIPVDSGYIVRNLPVDPSHEQVAEEILPFAFMLKMNETKYYHINATLIRKGQQVGGIHVYTLAQMNRGLRR